MVRAPDGCWVPAVVPVDTSRAAKDQGVALTDAQVTALGLPADPGEARAWLIARKPTPCATATIWTSS